MIARTFRSASVFALTLAAAACIPPAPQTAEVPPASPPPAPQPQAPAAPPSSTTPTVERWIDAPQTPGDWSYRRGAGTSEALFGLPNSEARLIFRCTPDNRTISIIRQGNAPATVPMWIRTETRDAALSAVPAGGAMPLLVANLPANDPLLDAIAFSRGRFAVEVQGLDALYVPSWPEITRVIEDCR